MRRTVVKSGWMELDEFHVCHIGASSMGHGMSIPSGPFCIGMVKIKSSDSTCRKDSCFCQDLSHFSIYLIENISSKTATFFIALNNIYPVVIGSDEVNCRMRS